MRDTIEVQKSYPIASLGQLIIFQLPQIPISKIIVKLATSPTQTGGSSHTYAANSIFKSIVLKVGNQDYEVYNGESGYVTDMQLGSQALRYLQAFQSGVLLPNDYYVIELPDALPANVPKQLELTVEDTMANTTDDGTAMTANTGLIDVLVETKDKVPGKNIVRKVSPIPKQVVGTATYTRVTLPISTRPGHKAAGLLICSDDNGTAMSEAEAALLTLKFWLGGKMIWAGTYKDLINETAMRCKSGIAYATLAALGWAMLPLQGAIIPSNTLSVEILWATAQTAHDLNWFFVELAGI